MERLTLLLLLSIFFQVAIKEQRYIIFRSIGFPRDLTVLITDRGGIPWRTSTAELFNGGTLLGNNIKIVRTNKNAVTIYNCDETGLYWKMLPNKTLAGHDERCAAGRKKMKDRITLMAAANASGSHKIPLLVIGKSKKPRCFKNINNLPVNYRHTKNAWMDRSLMLDWYSNIFIPEVKEKHDYENNKSIKILLIMDNAPSHPPADVFNAVCDFCTVLFLPANVTSLIQLLDQGIIEQFKRHYKRLFMTKILVDESDNIENKIRSFTLLDCLSCYARAWSNITCDNIRNCWKNLIPLNNPVSNIEEDSIDVRTFHSLLSVIPEYNSITEEDTVRYFNSDHNDYCDESQEIFCDNCNEIIHEMEEPINQDEISIKEAFKNLNIFIKFYKTKEDCTFSTLQVLEYLNQDMADEILIKTKV